MTFEFAQSGLCLERKRQVVSCLALALALLGCSEEEPLAVRAAPPVLVVKVEVRDIVDRIEATGQLLAKAEASVAAQVGGQVTNILIEEGSEVEEGEVLLEIDPARRELEVASRRAEMAERRAQFAEASREAERLRNLRAKGAASQSHVDEAETGMALARSRVEAGRAQLGLADRALADSSIRAPFSGVVARRSVSEGEYVNVGTPLVELVALDDIEVEFHLSERDSSLVRLGARVDVRVAPFPDEVFPAVVQMISPTIDSRTRTLRVKAAIEDSRGVLKPGLFARADLGLRARTGVIMVPEESVILRSDGEVVFRLDGDTQVSRVQVTTGVHEDGWLEVVTGLSAEDVVVVRGQTRLADGSVVSLRAADGTVAPPGSPGVASAQAAR